MKPIRELFNTFIRKVAPVKVFELEENDRRAIVKTRTFLIGKTISLQFLDCGQPVGGYRESSIGYSSVDGKQLAQEYCRTGHRPK